MPIQIDCFCGRTIRVKDDLAGKRIRCPDCRCALAVPGTATRALIEIGSQKPATGASRSAPAATGVESHDNRDVESVAITECGMSSFAAGERVDEEEKAKFSRSLVGVSWKRILIAVCVPVLLCAIYLVLREVEFVARPEKIAVMDLKVIGRKIQMQMDTQSPDYTSTPNIKKLREQILEKINGAEINDIVNRLDQYEILVADLPPRFMDVQPSTHLVAYERKALTEGGPLLTLDGQVHRTSANELQQLLASTRKRSATFNKSSTSIDMLLHAYSGNAVADISITDQCSVRFPGAHTTEKRTLATPMGNIDGTMFVFSDGDIACLASHTPYPVGLVEKVASDRKVFLEIAASASLATKPGSKRLRLNVEQQHGIYILEQDFSFDAGINSKGQIFPSGKCRIRAYLDGNDVYLFSVQISDDITRRDPDATQLLTSRFFESIRFKRSEIEHSSQPESKNEAAANRPDSGIIPKPEFLDLTDPAFKFPSGERMCRFKLSSSPDLSDTSMLMGVPAGSQKQCRPAFCLAAITSNELRFFQ